ncbi:glycoside hydrolase family 15 protein [Aquicoccus sp. SCR17]|nr:glycoside hydrolase family 15 protein [Carideicomes alvinocaridis]
MRDDAKALDAVGSRVPVRPGGYVPIGDYALIGDTLTAALVARDGSLDWLCLPDFDDESWFAALLDSERGGRFFVGAPDPAGIERGYLGHSAVLRSRITTGDGVLQVTDLMPLALDGPDRIGPTRRVLRFVEAVEGSPRAAIVFAPRPGYGSRLPPLRQVGARAWTVADGRSWMLLQSDIGLVQAGGATLTGEERLQAGETRQLCLSFCDRDPGVIPPTGAEAEEELEATLAFWADFAGQIDYEGPFREALIRSIVTLRLITYSLSGAVLAAATTSLPEAIGAGRNWDYRFCWLRDASFILHAFVSVGCKGEGAAFLRWLLSATQLTAPRLNTFYTVFGRTDISQRPIQSLEGYRSSGPVHLGNGAQSQLQLDAYGSMLGAALTHVQHGGTISAGEARRLTGYADVAAREWTLPDDGLWEMPGPRCHNTYSKVMCWAALDAYSQLCRCGAIAAAPDRHERERDAIRQSVFDRAWNERRGAFAGAYGADWLDASLLLMPRLGFIDARDPRMVSTFEAIDRELGHGAQMRRYADGLDGMPSTEGTFTACGFWAADYLARRGDTDEAERRIGRLVEHANDLGLMSEELDPESGAQLGNFPQGFSHAGLVGALLALKEAREKKQEGPT